MLPFLADLKKTEHGFKHIVDAGAIILKDTSTHHLKLAQQLLEDDSYQARMLATYLLGELWKSGDPQAEKLLTTKVASDENWRVQEMLAKAFDGYCKATGYVQSLPVIKAWLNKKSPNLKRAVIEGLRIWTSRSYFKDHPETAIAMISPHRSDDSEYVRKSAGNALRDIKRKHAALVQRETDTWDLKDPKTAFTYQLVQKRK